MNNHKPSIRHTMKKTIVLAMTLAAAASAAYCRTDIVAHRGYWTAEGSAQNSLRSLVKADSIGVYASEFDVWRSRDGVLFCNHDNKFHGVTFAEADSAVIAQIVLDNGESVPTLRTMLATARQLPELKLVFELKEHDNKDQEALAVAEGVAMIGEMGLADRTEYITFSKKALLNFVRHAPAGTHISYLTGDLTPEQVYAGGADGIDYHISVFRQNPDWIDRAHALGMRVNVWTVNDPADIQWCIDRGVDLITTNAPEEALRLADKSR